MKTRSHNIRRLRSRARAPLANSVSGVNTLKSAAKPRRLKQCTYKIRTRSASKHTKSQCKLCKKPFGKLESWKKLCLFCYWKIYGEIVKCAACHTEFLNPYKSQDKDHFCYSCKLALEGADKHKCRDCSKVFYQSKDSKIKKPYCYDCYLRHIGIKISCKCCTKEIYVKKEDLEWKNKCINCYIRNN